MSSLISPEIKKQYFDSNGDPLSGGKLYVYEAGTTTPVDSYVDAAETSVNTNPIVFDARGEFDGLFLRVGAYKFILTDADESIIWTEDNIEIRDVGKELDDLSVQVTTINTTIATTVAISRIASGEKSDNSSRARFLVPIGTTNQLKILANTNNLIYFVKGVSYTLGADLVASGLVSAPVSNNTALVNDSSLSDQDHTKTLGEFGTVIPYDNAGSEITSLDGDIAAFKIEGSGTEYFVGRIDNTNSVIKECQRGLFYDNAENPNERIVFSDNDTITLCKLTYVFLTTAGTMLVSYNEPVHSATEPSAPNDGDMWRDTTTGIWYRFNSTIFIDSESTYIGMCVQDENGNTVAARPEDFYKELDDINTFEIEAFDSTSVRSISRDNEISVYGNRLTFSKASKLWSTVTNFEDGESEAPSVRLYPYVKENGDSLFTPHAPLDNRGDLKGFYHPYEAWRCVGAVYNDSNSDLTDDNSVSRIENIYNRKSLNQNIITSSYTVSIFDKVLFLDTTSGSFTVTLPSAFLLKGEKIKMVKTSDDFSIVTIETKNLEEINGNTSTTIATRFEGLELFSNGSEWIILSRTGINGKLIPFTPTFTGFGSPTNIEFFYGRDGRYLVYYGKMTTGTTSATEARITIPTGLLTDIVDFIPSVRDFGTWVDDTVGAAPVVGVQGVILVDDEERSYLTFGTRSGTYSPLTPRQANVLFGNSTRYTFTARIPIKDWKGDNE